MTEYQYIGTGPGAYRIREGEGVGVHCLGVDGKSLAFVGEVGKLEERACPYCYYGMSHSKDIHIEMIVSWQHELDQLEEKTEVKQ